jgi:hypothetical protein
VATGGLPSGEVVEMTNGGEGAAGEPANGDGEGRTGDCRHL